MLSINILINVGFNLYYYHLFEVKHYLLKRTCNKQEKREPRWVKTGERGHDAAVMLQCCCSGLQWCSLAAMLLQCCSIAAVVQCCCTDVGEPLELIHSIKLLLSTWPLFIHSSPPEELFIRTNHDTCNASQVNLFHYNS